jgi:ribosome maturation factor RimP
MVMEREKVLQEVDAVVRPAVEGLGYELVDLQLGSEYGRWVLRLLVDRPGGITLQECAQISREVSPHLDVADAIPSRYALEVSSPGVRRPLKRPRDFDRFRGEKIAVRTREAIDGRKSFHGINRGLDEQGRLVIETTEGGAQHAIPVEAIREAHLDPDLPF